MNKPIFITGTGTNVGKTMAAAIITEALHADYWKPVQAGFSDGTDSLWVESMISNNQTVIHPEVYKLQLPASPHIAAGNEGIHISIRHILQQVPKTHNRLIIEGAGGLMVPLNENKFVLDLIKKLKATVIIVSKNELGSINHSLLTARVLQKEKVDVAGWVFNEEYMNYEHEIAGWSGFPVIDSIPHFPEVKKAVILQAAKAMKKSLQKYV